MHSNVFPQSRLARSIRGYSLIEIIGVVALIGVLGLAGVVAYRGYYQWGKAQADAQDLATINSSLEVLKYHNSSHASLWGSHDAAQHTSVLTAIRELPDNPIPVNVDIDVSKLASTGSGSGFRFTAYDSAGTSYTTAASNPPYAAADGGSGTYTETGVVLNGHEISGLTGGAGNLDGVPTVSRASGIRMVVANGGKLDAYTLVNGTGTTNVPNTIRPLDYSDTNQRVWVRSSWYNTLASSSNLSDVSDPDAALDNLGAGSMARQNAESVAITGGTAHFATDGFSVQNQIGSSGGSLWLNGGLLGNYTARTAISSGGSSMGSGLSLLGSAGGRDFTLMSTGSATSAGAGSLGFFDATAGEFRGVVDEQGNWGFGTVDPLARITVRGVAGQSAFRIENASGQSVFSINESGAIVGGSFDGGDIGTTQPGQGTFTDITVTGSVTFSALSDGFLKSDSSGRVSAVSGSSLLSSLGLGTMSTQNANSVAITGGTINGTSVGATTASTGKFTTLEASGSVKFGSLLNGLVRADSSGNLGIADPAALRTDLGLGTMATQNADAVAITGGTINGTSIGATTASTGKFTTFEASGSVKFGSLLNGIVRADGSGNLSVTDAATARTDLGLGTMATQNANAVAITGGTINGTSIGATSASTGKFTTFEATSTVKLGSLLNGLLRADGSGNISIAPAATVRTDLGLGTMATQNADAVAITGGAVDGTSIGATTASTGKFTSLHSTGALRHEGIGAGFMKTDASGNVSTVGAPTDVPIGTIILYPSTSATIDSGRFLRLNGQEYDHNALPELDSVLVAGGLKNPSTPETLNIGVAYYMGLDAQNRPVWTGTNEALVTWSEATGKVVLNSSSAIGWPVMPIVAYQPCSDGTTQLAVVGAFSRGNAVIHWIDGSSKAVSGNTASLNAYEQIYQIGSGEYRGLYQLSTRLYVGFGAGGTDPTGTLGTLPALGGGTVPLAPMVDALRGIQQWTYPARFNPGQGGWETEMPQISLNTGGAPIAGVRVSRNGMIVAAQVNSSSGVIHAASSASFLGVIPAPSASITHWRVGDSGRAVAMLSSYPTAVVVSPAAAPTPAGSWVTAIGNPNSFTIDNDWVRDSVLLRAHPSVAASATGYYGYHIGTALWDGSANGVRFNRAPNGQYVGVYNTEIRTTTDMKTHVAVGALSNAPAFNSNGGLIGLSSDSSKLFVVNGDLFQYWLQNQAPLVAYYTAVLGSKRYLPNPAPPTPLAITLSYYIKAKN